MVVSQDHHVMKLLSYHPQEVPLIHLHLYCHTATNGARDVSLKCESISFPGRNIDTTPDTNIYMAQPERLQQGFLLQS